MAYDHRNRPRKFNLVSEAVEPSVHWMPTVSRTVGKFDFFLEEDRVVKAKVTLQIGAALHHSTVTLLRLAMLQVALSMSAQSDQSATVKSSGVFIIGCYVLPCTYSLRMITFQASSFQATGESGWARY